MKLFELKDEEFPEVKTLSPLEIAKKHKVSMDAVTKELKIGIKHEMEHTKDKKVSKEIALDHMKEDPKYYSNMEK